MGDALAMAVLLGARIQAGRLRQFHPTGAIGRAIALAR